MQQLNVPYRTMSDNFKGNSLLDPIILSDSDNDIIFEIEDKDITYEEHWDKEQRQVVKEFLCGKCKVIVADEENCTSIRYATWKNTNNTKRQVRDKRRNSKSIFKKDIEDLAPFADISDISSSDPPDGECEQEIKAHEDNEVIEDSPKCKSYFEEFGSIKRKEMRFPQSQLG
ncbi:hypothetical protein FNV43_RR01176 [Rhamnella rubrinervis]|uniref:Uncharacterized protein n=1 Tax=Rhamnella rubrinervis TaxID=2594499 RepID=A0A8K0HS07_9ROSA|nr:hypothetical protein FNV43_RR01176 [Rhamnella rubrinervis]